MAKRPAFQFYPGDWIRSTDLRTCSICARGLWIDMICLMHEGVPYGHLSIGMKPIAPATLAKLVGEDAKNVSRWLGELEQSGVLSVTEEGCYFSRRMVRDEELRNSRAAGGVLGGNPKLKQDYNRPGYVYAMRRDSDGAIKIGVSIDPDSRKTYVARQSGDSLEVVSRWPVADMGAAEALLHRRFDASRVSGEWFSLSEAEIGLVEGLLEGFKSQTIQQTPSSSSSSSSSAAACRQQRGRFKGNLQSIVDLIEFGESAGLPGDEKTQLRLIAYAARACSVATRPRGLFSKMVADLAGGHPSELTDEEKLSAEDTLTAWQAAQSGAANG